MTEEGYIKFKAFYTQGPALPAAFLQPLLALRQRLFARGLIGAYENGIGYGNLSRRWDEECRFVISGSRTGPLPVLSEQHFALVSRIEIDRNALWCEGPLIASSESMSHAVIYRECPGVNGVIHVHHPEMWRRYLHQAPTTDAGATYGSPEMAYSIIDLLRHSDLKKEQFFVMEGHEEGIFVFGKTLEEAEEVLLDHFTAPPF